MDTSFEEKSVWIQLLGLAAGFGTYFIIAAIMLADGVRFLAAYVPVFVWAVIILVATLASGHFIAFILGGRPADPDERDRLIEWRSESNASWILGVGVFGALAGLVLGVGDVWIAHLLVHSMLLSQIAKLGFQILYYRRGMGR